MCHIFIAVTNLKIINKFKLNDKQNNYDYIIYNRNKILLSNLNFRYQEYFYLNSVCQQKKKSYLFVEG